MYNLMGVQLLQNLILEYNFLVQWGGFRIFVVFVKFIIKLSNFLKDKSFDNNCSQVILFCLS